MSKRVASVTIALFSAAAFGNATPAETDLEQLRDLRDRAIAAAAAPINELYRASLDQLLRRAIQDGDTAGAAKIRLELQSLAEMPAPAPEASAEASRMRAQLRDTEWQFSAGKTISLHADGSTTASWQAGKGEWKVVAPNWVEISFPDAPGASARVTVDPRLTTLTWALPAGDESHPEVARRIGAEAAE